MDDFGGYSLWNDTPDYGSSFDMGSFDLGGNYGGSQPSYDFGGSYSPSFDTSWLNAYTQPQAGAYGGFQQGPLGMNQPGAAPAPASGGAANPWIGGLLGAAGPLAGLIGALASGGQGPTSQVKPSTNQQAQMARGTQMQETGAMGGLPAQQMQMSLLQALQSGQGLPQGYQQLVEQAFQPQLGDLYSQAAQQGRARGFHDAPATSPPGGAILGPGLSNLQGQMAAAKLGLMHSLPQLFNQPAQTQAQMANAFSSQVSDPRLMQQTSQQPMGPSIANAFGNVLSGAAQGYYGTQQANQQQDMTQSLLKALQQSNSIQGLSGTRY